MMMDFQTFHKYFNLIRREQVPQFSCPQDNRFMNLELGENDEPVLRCSYCQATVKPGINTYNRIKEVVDRFYES